MKITAKKIKSLKACDDGYEWYIKNGSNNLLDTLLRVNVVNPLWARWLFVNLMNVKQKREIAIFCAEQVINIFEKKYPNDKRPRNAIKAAKAVLKNNTAKNRKLAAAAAHAAYAAYVAAAYADADAAAYAAYAAYAAAAYADAAYAANAAAAYAVKKALQEKIIRKAVKILDRKKNK